MTYFTSKYEPKNQFSAALRHHMESFGHSVAWEARRASGRGFVARFCTKIICEILAPATLHCVKAVVSHAILPDWRISSKKRTSKLIFCGIIALSQYIVRPFPLHIYLRVPKFTIKVVVQPYTAKTNESNPVNTLFCQVSWRHSTGTSRQQSSCNW